MEEILQSSHKMEPALIGCDEAQVKMDITDILSSEELPIKDAKEVASSTDSDQTTLSKALGKEPEVAIKSVERHLGESVETENREVVSSLKDSNCTTPSNVLLVKELALAIRSADAHLGESSGAGATRKVSAKSRLYEICATNYWSRPSFECCHDEGPRHMKMFTYKVTVEIEAATTTVLECFGEPRSTKKSAVEHAAEGALWYLQHLGFS